MMETQSVAGVACSDLNQAMSRIDGAALARLEQAIADAKAVFVFGAGRSLLMLKAFAMRLMHIGLKVHVVGDVVTPALQKGDLLLLASASGETASLVNVATKAKQLGGTVALLTIFPESTLGKLAGVPVRSTMRTSFSAPRAGGGVVIIRGAVTDTGSGSPSGASAVSTRTSCSIVTPET